MWCRNYKTTNLIRLSEKLRNLPSRISFMGIENDNDLWKEMSEEHNLIITQMNTITNNNFKVIHPTSS